VRTLANYIILAVAICFAILQPFLHIHLDKEHPIQQTGLHMGNEHEDIAIHSTQLDTHALTSASHTSEIISIDSVFKKEVDLNITGDTFVIALILFCLNLLTLKGASKFFPFHSQNYHTLRRRLPATRAPPQH
jgi:hypothetical protein